MKDWLAAVAVALGCTLPFAVNTGNSTRGEVPQATDLLCGRAVAVSCTGPLSPVTLFLRSSPEHRRWEIALPWTHRFEPGGSRVENRYELHLVCVAPTKVPRNGPSRPLLDPDDLVVKDGADAPIPVPADVYRTCDADLEPARPIRTVKPLYTAAAMRAKVQGTAVLFGIVDRNGVVGAARVVDSLEPGLDAEAQKAFEQWQFRPAMRGGQAVAVAVSVEMSFTLR